MDFANLPKLDLLPMYTFSVAEALPRLGIDPGAWEWAYRHYLDQVLAHHEEELRRDGPTRTLSGADLSDLVLRFAHIGAVAGIAAVDALRPSEPPF